MKKAKTPDPLWNINCAVAACASQLSISVTSPDVVNFTKTVAHNFGGFSS
jgi:hypothetical protein